VRVNGGCTVKYVEVAGQNLVLRPHNQAYPVALLPIEDGKKCAEYIVGRVCYVGNET
jgi:SOS-response transcriptional repressor LexA